MWSIDVLRFNEMSITRFIALSRSTFVFMHAYFELFRHLMSHKHVKNTLVIISQLDTRFGFDFFAPYLFILLGKAFLFWVSNSVKVVFCY